MDRNEAMIQQHVYWPDIIFAVCKEVTNYYTCQRTKQSNKKYGKLPDKLAGEIPQNKLCTDLIGTYVVSRNGKNKT